MTVFIDHPAALGDRGENFSSANSQERMKPIEETYTALLSQMLAFGDRHYDAGWKLLRQSPPKNVHLEHFDVQVCHVVRESLYYAFLLLERDKAGDIDRAQDILLKIFELQGKALGGARDGLWHYIAEESVFDWPLPDFNWADFNGMTLLIIWHKMRHLLDGAILTSLRESIQRAAYCVRRRNVTLDYTNVAIKGTFVTLAAAELLGDNELMEYATERTRKLHARIFRTSCFAEYNSPTYAAVSLAGLMAIDAYVCHQPSKQFALEIQHLFWRNIANHFHRPTKELAGPHSRAYTARLHDAPHLFGPMLQKASDGEITYDYSLGDRKDDFGAIYGLWFDPNLPEDAKLLLKDKERTASVVEETDPRDRCSAWWRPVAAPDLRDESKKVEKSIPARITSFMTPAFSLGSVNLQDGWEQRHNLIAYWKEEHRPPSFLRCRYLHDNRPCCSGYFASKQIQGHILAASFLTQYCDHHVSIPCDEITAEFLGPALEIDNVGSPFDVWIENRPLTHGNEILWRPGEFLWIKSQSVWIAVRLIAHTAKPFCNAAAIVTFSLGRLEALFPHYLGSQRKLRWSDFSQTHTSYSMWLETPSSDWNQWQHTLRSQKIGATFDGSAVDVYSSELRIKVPSIVLTRENLPYAVEI